MNGVVALTALAPALAGFSALVGATMLAWREPRAFGSNRARFVFVLLWLLIAPLTYAAALITAGGSGPELWSYGGRLGVMVAIGARLAALPIRRRVHWALGPLSFLVGASGALAARSSDPNSGAVGAVLAAVIGVPLVIVGATRLLLDEQPRRARILHEVVRWATVGLLAAVFTLLMPRLGERQRALETNRPLQAALDRARRTGVLDLSQQPLATLPTEIASLTQVTKLELTGCELRTLPDAIEQLVAVEEISLVRNALDDLGADLKRLAKLPKLRVLRLADNRLDVLPDEIRELRALTELHLEHNRLTTLPPGLFSLPELRVLKLGSELDGNRLTEVPPAVAQLPKLETLDVRNNPISAEALGALRAALPRTAILPAP